MPVINLFGRELPVYGLSWIIGIALAAVIAIFLFRRAKLELFDLACSAIMTVIGGIVGAKLLFLIISLPQIIQNDIPFMAYINGGFVFYGGLIGAMIALYLYLRIYKLPKYEFSDIYAVVAPLGHAIGRVGCHFGGCCYGMPYDGPGCVVYTERIGESAPLNTPLFPIQLLEASSLIVLFEVLLVVYLRRKPAGTTTFVYIVSYAVLRFVLEFFRGDMIRGIAWSLSTSQWISIGLVIFAVTCLVVHKKKLKKENAEA